MPAKKKWTLLNIREDRFTPDSTRTRTASNPQTSPAERPLPDTDDSRRVVSENVSRNAAQFQEAWERSERERKAKEERERLEELNKSPPRRPPAVDSDYPLPGGLPNPLTNTTNFQQPVAGASYSAKLKPPPTKETAKENAKAVATATATATGQDLDSRSRSDSAGPVSNENLSAETQCASSSPDRHSGVESSAVITTGDDMATAPARLSRGSSRFENRPPMSQILCRNGPQCRKLQEGTCHYNHDFGNMAPNGAGVSKRSLNVDSPAFTPTPKNATVQPAKVGISPKAVAAATFTPRGSGTVTPAANSHSKEPSGDFIPQQAFQQPQQFHEFVPGQSFLTSPQMEPQQPQISQQINPFENPFLSQQNIAALDASQTHINPYVQQASHVGNQPFFQDATGYKHPLNYHLYASIGPKRENLMAYQRSTADFFIPDDLREDLQRKAEATLQTYAHSGLPQTVEYFHSLVALDTNHTKGASTFGYPSWIYKATSERDGHTYALRRIEGFRLSSEAAIKTINSWKRIANSSLVRVHDAFTGRWFGDSSLIIVTDYHPCSQTLADKHLAANRHMQRTGAQVIPENDLWGYIVQLASALKSIHEGGVAAQTVTASKVLVTSKNRLRLNGCGVFDIIQHEQRRPVHELQRTDLQDLGRLILALASRNPSAHQNTPKALETVSRSYSERLRSCIAWLVAPPALQQDPSQPADQSANSKDYNIHTFLNNIADKVVSAYDSALHLDDAITSDLMRELENARLFRLMGKLNIILERPDTGSSPNANTPAALNQPSAAWSETGERYYLKLFRDYVFHQVDQDGKPVLDLGHIITCLNKLDAGIDEKIQLMTRDEQSIFITSYKEVKRGLESAWAEISRASNPSRR